MSEIKAKFFADRAHLRSEISALRSRVAELEQEQACVTKDRDSWREQSRAHNIDRIKGHERIAQLEAQLAGAREMQRVALNFMRIPYAPSQSDFVAYRAAVDLVSRPLAALTPEAPK